MMKMCIGSPTTTISQYATTEEPASTDRSDYSTQSHVDDNTDQPFEPNIRPGPNGKNQQQKESLENTRISARNVYSK